MPLFASLFKAIKGFLKFAYLGGAGGRISGNEPWRKVHIYHFIEASIEESIIHVKLLECPSFGGGQRKDSFDGSELRN